MNKIRKGDKVIVISGKDKGKIGLIRESVNNGLKFVVDGVNIAKIHKKPTRNSRGGIFSDEKPVDRSNLAILDPKLQKACRVGFKFNDDGEKVRYSKLSGELIKVNR